MFEYKACTIDYFMDEMQQYEISVILEELQYCTKQQWEQTRFISYIQAQSQSQKTLKLTDVMKFAWDKDKENKNTSISNEDIARLAKKAEEIIKQNNKK